MEKEQPYALRNNSRFYVLAATVCLSLIIFFSLRITVADERLREIRVQQVYGLTAVLYWYFVLLMSSGSKLIPKKPWVASLLFTRRAFGVGVAYFALLHFLLATTQQLDGWHGIWLLPGVFRLALVFGLTSLIVLLIMAILSIDKVVAVTKFRQWKWLGRVSYVAALLIIVHVWIIGTHTASVLLQFLSFQMLAILFAIEAARFCKGLYLAKKIPKSSAIMLGLAIWLVLTGGLLVMRAYVPSYSNNHTEHLEAGTSIHAH